MSVPIQANFKESDAMFLVEDWFSFTDEHSNTQYVASVEPETAPQSLRELADKLQKRETVERE